MKENLNLQTNIVSSSSKFSAVLLKMSNMKLVGAGGWAQEMHPAEPTICEDSFMDLLKIHQMKPRWRWLNYSRTRLLRIRGQTFITQLQIKSELPELPISRTQTLQKSSQHWRMQSPQMLRI